MIVSIDGNRRDSGVVVPELDPTPNSDQGEILGGVEEWRRQSEEAAKEAVGGLMDDLRNTDRWREFDRHAKEDGFRSIDDL